MQSRHGHAVFGQRARLVGAKNRGCAERFYRADSSRQYFFLRQSPCTECGEDRHHDGVLFRQQSHCQRNARKNSLQPVATQETINSDEDERKAEREQGEIANEDCRLLLQWRALSFERAQRCADTADRASWSDGGDSCHALTLNNQSARVDKRNIVAAGVRGGYCIISGCDFAHRNWLTGE